MKKLKLIATDLDGTLLDHKHELTDVNRSALETLADNGVVLVCATGRSRSSIPDEITKMKGVKYLITANGAKVFENSSNAIIYERYLAPAAIEYVRPLFADKDVLCEIFWDGTPHVEQSRYDGAGEYGIPFWFSDYFFKSRVPISDFAKATADHKHEIENINFVFPNDEVKERIRRFLETRRDLYELTTSLVFNLEIGGIGVDKGVALGFIAKRENISSDQIISFGDNDNDVAMLKYAGLGVATANAVPSALAAADYVTCSNDRNGVAAALKTLGFI